MDEGVSGPSTDAKPDETSENKRAAASKVQLLELAERVGSVSRACEMMDFSRDSYYRFKKLYAGGGEAALVPASRRRPILKNRVAPEIEAAVLALTTEHPRWGQQRVARALKERGLAISAAGVRCIWVRQALERASLRVQAAARSSRPARSSGEDAG
jgi:transposase